MAYLANPNYGTLPGAPMRLNWWAGPQFNISDLLASLPPVQSPVAPTLTPQDTAAQSGAIELRTDTGGAEPGGGGPGTGPGGLGRDPTAAERNPGYGFAPSGGVQTAASKAADLAAGMYATPTGPWAMGAAPPPGSPAAYNSNYGGILGGLGTVAGTALGVPGVGMLGGIVGSNIDMANYAANLRAAGIPIDPNYLAASFAGALPSLPGTNIGQWLSEQLGIPSARSQSEAARRDALAGMWGNIPNAMFGNTSLPPSPMTDEERARLELALPSMPSVGFVENPVPAFDPASLGREYGYGAAPGSMQGVEGAPQGQTGYQSGTYVSGIEGGSPDSQAGYGGAPSFSGGASYAGGAAGNAPGGGDTGRDTGFWRGGLVGAPPGRYAAGGTVGRAASNAAVRRAPPMYEYSQPSPPPPDILSDRDFYLSPFRPAPDTPHAMYGMGNPGGGAMRYPPVPGTADRMVLDPSQPWRAPPPNAPAPDEEGAAWMPGMLGLMQQYYGPSYAVGGQIPPAMPGDNITPAQFGALRAINPPGPDDQIGGLKTGEGVLTVSAMHQYPGLLAAANAGTLDAGRVKGMLTPAGMGRKLRLIR